MIALELREAEQLKEVGNWVKVKGGRMVKPFHPWDETGKLTVDGQPFYILGRVAGKIEGEPSIRYLLVCLPGHAEALRQVGINFIEEIQPGVQTP